jgi:hypothetical protein
MTRETETDTEMEIGTEPTEDHADREDGDGSPPADGIRTGVEPDPPTPSGPSTDADDPEGVLTPADLERVARQVRELDDERVLVPTDGTDPGRPDRSGSGSVSSGRESRDEPHGGRESRPGGSDGNPAGTADASSGLKGASLDPETAYAVDVTVRTDRGLAAESFGSNDVRVVFEELLRWYAGRIEPDRDPETVLAVLLAASDLDVTGR